MAKRNRVKTRNPNVVYQQGDVLFCPVAIPAVATPCNHNIVARGETTGHAHRLAEASDGLLYEVGDTLYLRVGARGVKIIHEEHGSLALPADEYTIRRVREYDHFAEEVRQVQD